MKAINRLNILIHDQGADKKEEFTRAAAAVQF